MANPTDSDVQLPNTGLPLVDTSQVTTGAGTVQRQRVAVADPIDPRSMAGVTPLGDALHADTTVRELLFLILLELQQLNINLGSPTRTGVAAGVG